MDNRNNLQTNQSGLSTRMTTQQLMVDFHGRSPAQSKNSVNWYLSHAQEANMTEFRFVTGRGNHENACGERGILYRELPDWISEENYQQIALLEKGDGYYDVKMKGTQKQKTPFSSSECLYQKALSDQISYIKTMAEKCDDEAQYFLGYCYQFAIGVAQDDKAAVAWYEKSSKKNNAMAQYALGGCYWQGKGVRQNDQIAIGLFEKSAAQNNMFAIHQLGDIYYYGEGVEPDLAKGVSYYEKAASLGFDLAKRKVGHAWFYGKGVKKKDESKGFFIYKELADNGDSHSAYNVACAYLNGQGIKQDIMLAFQYARQAADREDPDAQYLLSQFYHDGSGVIPDTRISFEYLQRSASNQNKHALFQLAFHKDIVSHEERLAWLIKAGTAGHIVAQAMIVAELSESLLLKAGLSVADQKNIEEKFWLQPDSKLLSMQDHPFKLLVLDAYFLSDSLTKKRKKKIMRLLTELAAQENPEALGRLGAAHDAGKIAKLDREKAKNYWLEGARLGSAGCYCNLGYYYAEPAEGEPDYEKAFYYYSRGAEKNDANSHNYLGILYKNGWGVHYDREKAIFHLSEAMRLDSGEEAARQRHELFYQPVYTHATYNMGALFLQEFRNLKLDDPQRKQSLTMAIFWFLKSEGAGFKDASKVLDRLGVDRKDKGLQESSNYEKSNPANFWKPGSDKIQEGRIMTPVERLTAFTEKMGLECIWKISKEDKAWCYVPDDCIPQLESHDLTPAVIRKTQTGKYILLIDDISSQNLAQLSPVLKTDIRTGLL